MAASTGHAYEDSQRMPDESRISGITTEHAGSGASDVGAIQDSQSTSRHAHLHTAGYVESEWSFSTTTETQLELPEPPQRSIAEGRLTLSSNATSLSDSADKAHDQDEPNASQSNNLPSTILPKSRPSLSTIAQLPDSSYLSALSGSPPSSQLQIPTLAQLDLPETQSFPSRHALPSSVQGESQQSISDKTESQPSQHMERKRTHSALGAASSEGHLAFKSRTVQGANQHASSTAGVDETANEHHAKKSRSETFPVTEPNSKLALHSSPGSGFSSSTIPSTKILESATDRHAGSSQQGDLPTSSPGRLGPTVNYGTQDMIMQTSSAPSVHVAPLEPATVDLLSHRKDDRAGALSQASGIDKSVSQGRGLPVRRPWHGRATSSSTSSTRHVSSLAVAAPESTTKKAQSPGTSDIGTGKDLLDPSRPEVQGSPTIKPMAQTHETPPSPVSLDSPNDQRLQETSGTDVGEETCLDRESQPGKNNAGRVDTIPGGQRLFVRDGKLYYLATVSSIGRDSFRVDFDDGSFSEVSRASLQRSAVSPKLCPGDVLVSNTQKKQGLQQRYTYIEQQASTSEKALKKDAMIKVRPVSARHSLGEVKEVVDDEDIVQMSISSMALVAGPNIQDKSRAIDVNHLFPSLESTSIGTSRVKTGQKIVRTDMLKGIGLLLTSVHSIWDTSALVFSVSNGAIVIENLDSIVGFALSKADSKGKSKATCGGNALSSLNTILLVSPGHVTTPKYLKALALGIPCVSATWLEDCAHQHERLSWKPYALGAGCTTRSPSAILGIQAGAITRPAFDLKQLLDRQHELYMFSSKQLVYLHDDDDAGAKRAELASTLFRLLGGDKVTIKPISKSAKLPNLKPSTIFLLDGSASTLNKSLSKAVEGHTIQSWQWFKDCVVSGHIVPSI